LLSPGRLVIVFAIPLSVAKSEDMSRSRSDVSTLATGGQIIVCTRMNNNGS